MRHIAGAEAVRQAQNVSLANASRLIGFWGSACAEADGHHFSFVNESLRRLQTDRIDLLQFRIRFLEHLKIDVAVRSTQMQLVRAFEGHANRTV